MAKGVPTPDAISNKNLNLQYSLDYSHVLELLYNIISLATSFVFGQKSLPWFFLKAIRLDWTLKEIMESSSLNYFP